MKAGKAPGNFVRGGLSDGFVKMSAYGPAVSAAAKTRAEAVKAEIMKGGFAAFMGPLKDNKGNTVIPAGKALVETAVELESTNWLVEGVIGAIA
jgi:simple sugar transport system substrate-binding protein